MRDLGHLKLPEKRPGCTCQDVSGQRPSASPQRVTVAAHHHHSPLAIPCVDHPKSSPICPKCSSAQFSLPPCLLVRCCSVLLGCSSRCRCELLSQILDSPPAPTRIPVLRLPVWPIACSPACTSHCAVQSQFNVARFPCSAVLPPSASPLSHMILDGPGIARLAPSLAPFDRPFACRA